MKRYKSFFEKSFFNDDVPYYFFMVFSVSGRNQDTVLANLKKKILPGVKGISDSILITKDFVSGGECILLMPGEKVVQINSISRVMYDNPDYLVSDNFKALKRLWVKSDASEIMKNILSYWKTVDYQIKDYLSYKDYSRGIGKQLDLAKINTFNEFVKETYSAILNLEADYNTKEFIRAIQKAGMQEFKDRMRSVFNFIAKTYSSEGEWLIKDRTLKIPAGSKLLLMGRGDESDPTHFGQVLSLLDKDYEIKIVSTPDFAKMRNIIWNDKVDNREADRMFYSFFDLKTSDGESIERSRGKY